jgi:hypothetical protein
MCSKNIPKRLLTNKCGMCWIADLKKLVQGPNLVCNILGKAGGNYLIKDVK